MRGRAKHRHRLIGQGTHRGDVLRLDSLDQNWPRHFAGAQDHDDLEGGRRRESPQEPATDVGAGPAGVEGDGNSGAGHGSPIGRVDHPPFEAMHASTHAGATEGAKTAISRATKNTWRLMAPH